MSYGLQISASGVMAALYRQDVWANNLANLDSVGFKADLPSTYARPAVRQEDGVGTLPSNTLLEKLGAGAMLNPNRINFEQGTLRTTGNRLDVGVEGRGFLVVQDASDAQNPQRLTRDGRMTRNTSGELVMATTGLPVLDRAGQRISLPAWGEVKIDGDGTVQVSGRTVAQLAFIDVGNTRSLRKAGHSMFFAPREELASPQRATGTLRQGMVEESSIDEVRALLAVTNASRDVDANVDIMRAHDRMMERAIASLGRAVV